MNSRVKKAVLESLPGAPGYLLDLPSGDGWLARAAQQKGHSVVAGDLCPQKVGEVRFFVCDLNQAIPLRTNFFDYIYCCEGIEHLHNAHLPFAEFSRILKSTGLLILTFPNILNIGSRFKFLFSGRYLSFPHLYEVPRSETGQYVHEHINPVSISQLFYIAKKYNLSCEGLLPQPYEGRKVIRRIWFLPVLQTIGKIKQLLAKNPSKKLLWSILSSRECLLHDHVIVRFSKTDARGGTG
jgi:SAM-dependent methyltransferase